MKILQRRDDLRLSVIPGDKINLWFDDPSQEKPTLILSHHITEAMVIDTALVIQTDEGELGLEFGIGGVVGKRKATS